MVLEFLKRKRDKQTKRSEYKYADLHAHTVFSDGTYTPKELIQQAKAAGLDALAIVDHDTIDGIAPSLEQAESEEIEILPGIELSAEYNNSEIHILGYLIDCNHKTLREKLSDLKKRRIERVFQILDRLKEINIHIEPQSVFDIAGDGSVGRLHIARAMLKEGAVSSIWEAFQKYIGDNCPAYILGFKITPQEAINLIKEAKGIPVLAHPYLLHNDGLIADFVDYGLMGLEVYYPEHSQSMINFYLRLAKENNLLVTGGSDYHGDAKPDIRLGSIKIPYSLVEDLKKAKEEC